MPAHKNIRLWFPISILFILFALTSVWADDGAMEGVGGSLRPMQEHPSIHMLSERVIIDLSPGNVEVDCSFTFKNDGPATMVRMGFPESGGGTDVDPKHPNGFSHFETWIDGVRVQARIEGLEGQDQSWERWRVKKVRFAKGQKRLIRVRYGGGIGGTSDGTCYFEYRLDTGASWKGKIGKVDLTIRLKGFQRYWHVGMSPSGYQRKGNLITWHWENLEPGTRRKSGSAVKRISGINVDFYPGYADIDVNGEVPYRGFLGWPKPQLINRQVWAALDFLPHWLQCQVEISKEAATLMAGKRKLVLKLNNYAAILNDKPIKMKHAPLLRERNWFVCVNQIIPLLGGTARFDKKTGITYLTLPKK